MASSSPNASADENQMNITEVEAFSHDGSDLTTPSTVVTAGSALNTVDYPHKNLVDRKVDTFAHTGVPIDATFSDQWFQIDLGMNKQISRVKLYNRYTCCQRRMVGVGVKILQEITADNTAVVYKSLPLTSDDIEASILGPYFFTPSYNTGTV